MSQLTITNATVVLRDHMLERATVRVDDGWITVIEANAPNSVTQQATIVDADGAYLIPGVVDMHNDNLEFEINPRVNADLPLEFALSTMERRLAGAGVTTEFHSVSFQERAEKGRKVLDAESRAAFLAGFDDSPSRAVRHNILHRLDVRTPGSLESALPSLRTVSTPYVSLNDHTPGQGQYRDVDRLIRMAEQSQKARGRTEAVRREWYLERMRTNLADMETVPAFYGSIAQELARTPMLIATHDDDTVEKVHAQLVLGATINEFPVSLEAAHYARQQGMTIVVGAPNMLRGASQSGNISARDLAADGLVDAICADYHAPCLIPAAFKLHELGFYDLPRAIATITRNPAQAMGMDDRGEIAVGKLADLVLVRIDANGIPQVEATYVAGVPSLRFARYPTAVAPETVFSMNGSSADEFAESTR